MKKKKLIERIRKLYAMSQDASSPNEAEIAARRCRAMMDEHDIKEADLATSEFLSAACGARKSTTRIPLWYNVLAVGVAKFNDVQTSRSGRDGMLFNGFETDVLSAQLMLEYLVESLQRGAAHSEHSSRGRINSFRMGFSTDIQRRLYELAERRKVELVSDETGTALVVLKEQLLAKEFGPDATRKATRQPPPSREAAESFRAGVQLSESTGLNSQVRNSSPKPLLNGS